MGLPHLLQDACERAARYLESAPGRPVAPPPSAIDRLRENASTLPEEPQSSESILALLDELGSPATVVNNGGRYFGFVTGATTPAALAAAWLAAAWGQNAALRVMSPAAAELEDIALGWARDLLGLPHEAGGGLVTGATMANFCGLVAARHALLERRGWDVEARGLFGAPEIRVIAGNEIHASMLKALALAGLGRDRIIRVPVDGQGRMRADALPDLDGDTIVCLQAGNVNTGAFDPAAEICPAARRAGAWVHVDGAFGLWAAASPRYRQLVAGFELADSWATDAHKWPNAGYDCGIVFVRDARQLAAAMSVTAAYLMTAGEREPAYYAPEASRRARGVELWAALASFGRSGFADLVDRTCAYAARFARELQESGFSILNDVVLNQALVSFGEPEVTQAVIRRIQQEGTCWCGSTVWQGQTAMRISVSSWATTDDDVTASLAAIRRIAAEVKG